MQCVLFMVKWIFTFEWLRWCYRKCRLPFVFVWKDCWVMVDGLFIPATLLNFYSILWFGNNINNKLCFNKNKIKIFVFVQWNLGIRDTHETVKTVLTSEVVVFLRFISVYWIGLGTEVAALNPQVVPISQVVLKTGFTVYYFNTKSWYSETPHASLLYVLLCKQTKMLVSYSFCRNCCVYWLLII